MCSSPTTGCSPPADDPAPDLRASFDAIWERALASRACPVVDEPLSAPKWQFLCHLADAHGLALHGSADPSIGLFEPRQANDLRAFGNQKAVYAAGDGIWAMFFAVVNRDLVPSVTNACVRLADAAGRIDPPRYVFSVSRSALAGRPWRQGTVYVLPGDTFMLQPPIPVGSTRRASRSWPAWSR